MKLLRPVRGPQIIESFAYTGFEGPIVMKNPQNQFVIFEEHDLNVPTPKKLYLGRLVAESGRRAIANFCTECGGALRDRTDKENKQKDKDDKKDPAVKLLRKEGK